MVLSNEIQDIYTRKDHDHFYQGAIDFREAWVIEDNDMVILNNVDALWEAIVGCLHTPKGVVDGVGLETYGSKLLELRGKTLNYHIMELAKTYILETIPQFQGYVYDFPDIKFYTKKDTPTERQKVRIDITVSSKFGRFTRTTYL